MSEATFMASLIWRPFFDPPLPIYLLAGALVAAAVWACLRTWPLRPLLATMSLTLRLVLIAAITALLMGPSVLPPTQTRAIRPTVTLLVDTSESMLTRDMDDRSRFRFVAERWLSGEALEALDREAEVRVVGFAESPRPLAAIPSADDEPSLVAGRESQVVASVQQSLSELPAQAGGSALVVLTDGRDSHETSPLSAARFARARQTPVHVVPLGGPTLVLDLSVLALPMQDYLLQDEAGQLSIKVLQSGAPRAMTHVLVEHEGEQQRYPIVFNGQSTATLDLPVRESRVGRHRFDVRVEPLPGEIEQINNKQTVFLDVTSKRFRVLVLEGEPYWDTKFLAQALRRDERVELVHMTQVTPDRQLRSVTRAEGPSPAVASLEDLCRFDVVVLGRGIEHLLSQELIEQLPRYVGEFGGRLVLARGRPYDPSTAAGRAAGRALSVLEPVVWGKGTVPEPKLFLEPAGERHPAMALTDDMAALASLFSALPTLTQAPLIEREKPMTHVLARVRPAGMGGGAGQGQPAIVTLAYERGSVLAVLGEGLWQWSLHARNDSRLEGLFERFWSNAIRWLAMGGDFKPGQEVAMRLSRQTLASGEPLEIDVIHRLQPVGAAAPVTITDPRGQQHHLVLRSGASALRRRASFTADLPGLHQIEHITATGEHLVEQFSVHDVNQERLQASANLPALKLLASESGGVLLDPYEPGQLVEVLRKQRAASITPPRPVYVWNTGWILVLIVGWAGTEWILRRKGGLL